MLISFYWSSIDLIRRVLLDDTENSTCIPKSEFSENGIKIGGGRARRALVRLPMAGRGCRCVTEVLGTGVLVHCTAAIAALETGRA